MNIKVNLKIPKEHLKNINVQRALAEKQTSKTVPEVMRMFEGTVNGWKSKPRFGYDQTINSSQVGVVVGSKGEFGGSNKAYNVYSLVSIGSPRHYIPKRAFKRKWLRFRSGYTSSTKPGSLESRAYSRSGGWMKARQVNHPGFTGRAFDEQIAQKYKGTFEADMQEAINDAVRIGWG